MILITLNDLGYHLDSGPTMIVIGESGVGKSSLCNSLYGVSPESNVFPASKYSKVTTQETKILPAKFKGNKDRPVTIVDTQGFNDPNAISSENPNVAGSPREANLAIILELMKNIHIIPSINIFAVCINGTTLRRINQSLLYMLYTFAEIFGHKTVNGVVKKDIHTFWKKCVFVVTHLTMDRKAIKKRVGKYDPDEDREIIRRNLRDLTEAFGVDEPSHLIIDAKYDSDDPDEVDAYNNATERLYDTLINTEPAMTAAMQDQLTRSFKGKIKRCLYFGKFSKFITLCTKFHLFEITKIFLLPTEIRDANISKEELMEILQKYKKTYAVRGKVVNN